MKRIVILVIMACAVWTVEAQTSAEILRGVSSAIDSLGSYTANFVMSSEMGDADGEYSVTGSKFRIDAGAVELVCDGRTVWEVDHQSREIAVDNVGYDATIWTNPAKAFSMLDTRFDHQLLGSGTADGRKLHRLRLTAREQTADSFVLLVDAATLLPYKAVYGSGESEVSLRFVRIRSGESDPLKFSVRSEDYPDYEVVDLR